MSKQLSLADLSFFDSHVESNSASQKYNVYNDFSKLSLGPSTSKPSVGNVVQTENQKDEDEDEFGDFVQFEPPSIEASELDDQAVRSPQIVDNTTSSRPLNVDIIDTSIPNQPSFESSARDLGSIPSSLRFGQTSQNPEVSSSEQWTAVLSARAGPSIERLTPSLIPEVLLNQKRGSSRTPTSMNVSHSQLDDARSLHLNVLGEATSSSYAGVNLLDFEPSNPIKKSSYGSPSASTAASFAQSLVAETQEEETWEEDDDFSDFATVNPLPDPDILLTMMHETVLPSANKLLDSLKPLSYALKKRVLSNPNTKTFLTGYMETVNIAARIMAGRNRRVLTVEQKSRADREARHLEQVWLTLSTRLQIITPSGSTMPVLNAKLAFPDTYSGSVCSICGLSKVEIIKGQPRPIWINEGPLVGHKTCIGWWNNRCVFGLT
jgi:hypothetical protein